MGIFEKNLLILAVRYFFRWLTSNGKNRKVKMGVYNLLEDIDRVATGESQVADDAIEALGVIHGMIIDWLYN